VSTTTASQYYEGLAAAGKMKGGLVLKALESTDEVVKSAAELIVKHRLFDLEKPLVDGTGRRKYTPIPRGILEKMVLQSRFTAVIKLLLQALGLYHVVVDSHACPTIGSAKPAGVAYPEVTLLLFLSF
jgi:hypothetical protein